MPRARLGAHTPGPIGGVVRSAHLCPDRPGAMLVMECAGLDEARAELAALPMVAQRLIRFELSRLLPYDGLKALFRDEHRVRIALNEGAPAARTTP